MSINAVLQIVLLRSLCLLVLYKALKRCPELGQASGVEVGVTDVQSMTPAALPLLKRARVAGQENTSPNLGRPAPAGRAKTSGEGPFPPLPAMQSAIGVTAVPAASCGSLQTTNAFRAP